MRSTPFKFPRVLGCALGRELGLKVSSFHYATEAYKIADVLAAEKVAWVDLVGPMSPSVADAVRGPMAVHVHLGEGGAQAVRDSRAAAITRLREVFDDARALRRNRRAFRQRSLFELSASRLDLEGLRFALGHAVRTGVAPDVALAAANQVPAKIHRQTRHGTLASGKMPMSSYGRAIHSNLRATPRPVIVRGKFSRPKAGRPDWRGDISGSYG